VAVKPVPQNCREGCISATDQRFFVGWFLPRSAFLVYVWLEKPSSSIWGSVVAAPVFRDVVKQLVVLMNIPPDAERLSLKGQ